MKTINDELKAIALVCNTSDKFAERAKTYLKMVKGIYQPLMTDSELRDMFRQVNKKKEEERAWDVYYSAVRPALTKRPECKNLWYETWLDLKETWVDKWFSSFRFMSINDIVEVCVKYMNEHERSHSSSDYIDMLCQLPTN